MKELIDAVRSERCLYDLKHPDYMNIRLKDSIWKRIAEALNLKDGSEAKKSWEKLRNNHRDALRRQKSLKPKGGSGSVNIKSWRFQEDMAFLIPHMANRPSNTNINEDILNDESYGNSNTTENDIQKSVNETDVQESGDEETNENLESPFTGTAADQRNKRRRYKRSTLNHLINKSIEDHERKTAHRQQERERLITNTNNDFTISNVKNDPLFHFFISMYETTKRLPPLSQHNIKTNIFSVVSLEESKNLAEYSADPLSSNLQNSDARSHYFSYTPSPVKQQPPEGGTELDSSGNMFIHSPNSLN